MAKLALVLMSKGLSHQTDHDVSVDILGYT